MALLHVVAVLALASTDAEPREVRSVAPVFSVGAAYAVPIGGLFRSATIDVNNVMKGGFPIAVEAGVALWEHWHVVAYAGYAWLDRSERCLPNASCTGSSLSFGGQVQWWTTEYRGWVGFVGLGGGWEKLTLSSTTGTLGFSGFDGVLTLGGLYSFGKVGIGPFFQSTLGVYSQLDATIGSGTGSETIRNQTLHGWLIFGVRVDLWL